MEEDSSNSLLKELNNNPAQFTRIMEILNKLQDDGEADDNDNKMLESQYSSQGGDKELQTQSSWFG